MTAADRSIDNSYGAAPSEEALHEVLGRLGEEAGVFAAELTHLDHELGLLLDLVEEVDLSGFQCTDRIRQGLEGLAQFLESLSKSVDRSVVCDPVSAANNLKLRAQAQRLVPGLVVPSVKEEESDLW